MSTTHPHRIDAHLMEEHELPSVEAVLAGTLALMTGYSQALQAALHPEHRVAMGAKIACNLALLADHPLLSAGFQQVVAGLRGRWEAMGDCSMAAARECAAGKAAAGVFRVEAPARLQ
ncbi:hypothetical protein BH11PSE9_BH11PSE9_36630 [soil metagenome]